MLKKITVAVLAAACTSIYAEPILFKGHKEVSIDLESNKAGASSMIITLPTVELTATQKSYLKNRLAQNLSQEESVTDLPAAVNLGMQGTPVLNQGRHGSCVTFAVTAAFDAAIGAGDYISQLCNLELGSYLYRQGKIEESGWDGTWGSWVLEQIAHYGVVNMNYQTTEGCAGMYEYPVNDERSTGHPMSDEDFLAHSIPIGNLVTAKEILVVSDAFTANANMDDVFTAVKKALASGNRVTFGSLLDVSRGHVGALGKHNKSYDTWMLTDDIKEDAESGDIDAGHEMVIMGYDDQATAKGPKGEISRGLFILRNSWSSSAGDKGNYYMSYDYFKLLTLEAAAIQLKKTAHSENY